MELMSENPLGLDDSKIMKLDLSKVESNDYPVQRNLGELYESMRLERTPNGILRGYLVKTAQSITKFQRKHFYRRFYELNLERKDLKIYEKDGGPLKDSMKCDVTHVVTNLRPELRADYK